MITTRDAPTSSTPQDVKDRSLIFQSPATSSSSDPFLCRIEISENSSRDCKKCENAAPSALAIQQGSSSTDSFDGGFVGEDLDDLECSMLPMQSLPHPSKFSCPHRVLIYTTCYNVIDGVTLTVRKVEAEILAGGGHVCILTTRSGSDCNTNLDGTHPNRTVIFLDNAVLIPFLKDENNPDCSYYLGFSLSSHDREKIDYFKPTICHITVPDSVGLDVIQYARQNSLPLMGTYHSNIVDYMDHYGLFWLKPALSAFFMHAYNFLQALYVPTPYIKTKLIQCDKIDRITNVQIWGRGIDLERFSPANRSKEFRKKLGILPDEVVILFVGRLVVEKRPDIFANVIRRLHQEGHLFKAIVVGAGPYEREMKDLPNTLYMGWQSGESLSITYASSDIFLFPSALETFGNVTLEAAASGLPLVVEECCSGHLVLDGVNGFACDKDDESSFYESTLDLLMNNRRRKLFAIESRRHSLKYEMQTIMRQMIDNYTAITDQFYDTYQGDHSIRDMDYKNPNSFRAGTTARPLLLRLVEILIVWLVPVTWFLYISYANFQNKCSSLRQLIANVPGLLCCFRRKLHPVHTCPQKEEMFLCKVDHFPPDMTATRNLSAAPKEEIIFVSKFSGMIVNILLFVIRIQSMFMVKIVDCFECTRLHKDSRYIK